MKTTITLTEAEIRVAILEWLESNTRHIEEINHQDCKVTITAPQYGETTAIIECDEKVIE